MSLFIFVFLLLYQHNAEIIFTLIFIRMRRMVEDEVKTNVITGLELCCSSVVRYDFWISALILNSNILILNQSNRKEKKLPGVISPDKFLVLNFWFEVIDRLPLVLSRIELFSGEIDFMKLCCRFLPNISLFQNLV